MSSVPHLHSTDSAAHCVHAHRLDAVDPLAERNTRRAVWLTAAMMVAEIAGGWYFNSMALLADGWHMGSHAVALGLSALAYAAARRLSADRRFSFGTGKIEVLGGYTSALLLVGVAVLMAVQSVGRLMSPLPIHYEQAISIALVGLVVNLVCARLLHDGAHHGHGEHHGHPHDNHGQQHGHAHGHDLNLRSAYLHVVADAATSVLAILALVGGWVWGWSWLDPLMGLVGAVLVAVWAWGLLRDTGRVLLDADTEPALLQEVRDAVAEGPVPATITDLHVWRVGKGRYACIVSLQTDTPVQPAAFRRLIAVHEELVHITVEVNLPDTDTDRDTAMAVV